MRVQSYFFGGGGVICTKLALLLFKAIVWCNINELLSCNLIDKVDYL